MNVVILTDLFHPDTGYYYNLLSKYLVKKGHKVTIFTSELDNTPYEFVSFVGKNNIVERDKNFENKYGVKIVRLKTKAFFRTRAIYNENVVKIINDAKPDIFETTNDSFAGIKFILSINKLKYPIIFESSMLKIASHSKIASIYEFLYKKMVTPIIIKNRLKVIRVQNDPYLEQYLGIPLLQCPYISFGTDTNLFAKNLNIKLNFRKENNIDNDSIVFIYTGKIIETKGAKILANAFIDKFDTDRKIVLLIVGNINTDYGKEVLEIYRKSKNKIVFFSPQKYIDLYKFYCAADCCIFPKECSLSFFDAQSCGLPVIFDDNNVNLSRNNCNNALNFKIGDYNSLHKTIQYFIDLPEKEKNIMSLNAINNIKKNYDYEDTVNKVIDLYDSEIKRFKNLGGRYD